MELMISAHTLTEIFNLLWDLLTATMEYLITSVYMPQDAIMQILKRALMFLLQQRGRQVEARILLTSVTFNDTVKDAKLVAYTMMSIGCLCTLSKSGATRYI